MGIFKEMIETNNTIDKRKDEVKLILNGVLKENIKEIIQLIHPLSGERCSVYFPSDKSMANEYGSEVLIVRRENDHSLVVEKTDNGYRFDYTIICKCQDRPSYITSRETLSQFTFSQSNEQIKKAFEDALMKYVKKFV